MPSPVGGLPELTLMSIRNLNFASHVLKPNLPASHSQRSQILKPLNMVNTYIGTYGDRWWASSSDTLIYPFYFRFSFTFPTSLIHHYAPPLRRDRARSRTTIALDLLDRSCLFDDIWLTIHMYLLLFLASPMCPLLRSNQSRSLAPHAFYSFAICSHSCLPFVFNLPVFTFH